MTKIEFTPRLRRRGHLAVTVAALALAGCTSSGFSDFANDLKTYSIVKEKPAEKTQAVASADAYPQPQAETAEIAPAETAVASLDQPLRPESVAETTETVEIPKPGNSSFRLASLLQSSEEPAVSPQAYADPDLSREEIEAREAQARIERLAATFKHGKCKSGWGTQAKKLDANRYTPGHRYYIEIRMRHTPPLPIGHTYTAYGRLDENGRKLDESLVMLAPKGGYAGAAAASSIPMPSVMTPTPADCNIKPVAAYRVSLSDAQYENLLKAIKQAKIDKPKYKLFLYNCNHFTSRISESVGIKTPKNKYTSSLVYMYDIIRENEGSNYTVAARTVAPSRN